MSNQFENIKNLSVEIGQPTYVELISVKEQTEVAIIGPSPNVEQALNSLAYGKQSRRYIQPTRTQGVITPIRRPGIAQKTKYSIASPSKSVESYRSDRISSEFKSLLVNPFAAIACSSGPVTCDEPPTDCMIDFGVVLDNTGSMGGTINAVKAAVDTIAGYFQEISGGNYRMALMTFGDCSGVPGIQYREKFPTGGTCGNIAQFKTALNGVTAQGGVGYPEAGDIALERAVDGTAFGAWRDDPNVIKVILFITDASVGGCNDIHDPEDLQRLYDAATGAASCGIKIIYAATPARSLDVRTAGQQVASITNGLYVETPSTGANLAELVYSFVFSLCSAAIAPPECAGGTDIILNGTFDANIAGWEQVTPTVSWNSTKRALELDGLDSTTSQSVSGLNPGDLATIFFDVIGGDEDSVLTYGFAQTTNVTYNVAAGAEAVRLSFNMNVPDDGILTVMFKTTTNVLIDNVRLCISPVVDCGLGSNNLILNSHFVDGIQYWSDQLLNEYLPYDDERWWDSGNDALIISLSGASFAQQSINGLVAGQQAAFGFTLLSHEPSTIDDLELIYEVTDQYGTVVLTEILRNGDITFPYTVYKPFTIPSSTIIIRFKTGTISGGARIKDIIVCDQAGVCQPGYTKISYNQFDESREEWDGGTYFLGIPSGNMLVTASNHLTRTYTDLEPGATFNISIETLDDNGIIINLTSDGVIRQATSLRKAGIITTSCTVQESGIVHVSIASQAGISGDAIGSSEVDNILVCVSNPVTKACDGSIKELSAGIEWNGIPRRPVNIFNLFARITLRDPLDPHSKTTTNLIPISDGHIGTELPTTCGTGTTCDFWKQHGNSGSAEALVTGTNLTSSNIATVTSGTFWPINTRENWLWSIPANPSTSTQDSLVSTFLPESVGAIVESVEILYLANQITPSGSATSALLYMGNTDDETIELLYSNGDIETILTDVGNIEDIAIDEARNKLFWIRISQPSGEDAIWVCDLDGSNPLRVRYTGMFPTGIGLDTDNQHIYYSEQESKQIRRCNYDGSNDQLIITSIFKPQCVTVDKESGYLYWAGYDQDTLLGAAFRCNLDGSGFIVLASLPNARSIKFTSDKLYVGVATTLNLPTVYKMNLNGSNVQALPTTGLSTADDLEIKGNTIYIAESGIDKIVSIDLDGNNRQELTTATINRRGIALASGSRSNISDPVCVGSFNCAPDQTDNFDIVIKYKNNLNISKEFRVTVNKNNLYPQEENFLIGDPWDTISTLGAGIRGSMARWESATFNLDTIKGDGLDQCTTPIGFITTGTGNLVFGEFTLSGTGSFFDPCNSEVIITEVTKGSRDNETQSIVLPTPSGGTWTLTVDIDGAVQTATLPYDADAGIVQIRLERLTNIGRGNISVTGTGTSSDPFMLEFIGDLAGTDIPLVVTDGSSLSGTAFGVVQTIASGTKNERQTITVIPDTLNDLIVQFNGASSIPIVYNWSLNQKQAAIMGIPTIGDGGVTVTGGTTDRDSPYTGNLIIDFEGPFANSNVPQLVVQPTTNYSASTNWQGGVGTNEKQKIQIAANSGTFTIKIYDPDDESGAIFFITAPIQYDATSAQIKAAIVSSGYVTDSDISVTQPDPALTEWIVEFIGARASTNIKQMEIDAAQLFGGSITVSGVTDGGSSLEKQRITIKNATAGYFKLTVEINGVSRVSGKIPWNTTAVGLRQILEQHPQIDPGDITVVQNVNGSDPDVTARFTVTFKGAFGDVALMVPDYARTLLCNPIVLPPVPPPPYEYPIPDECEIEDLSCQSGPLLSRPCPGDEPLPEELCCTDLTIRESANVSTRLLIQRDLFDPNKKTTPRNVVSKKMTIKDIAVLKGLNPSQFNPYLRNLTTGKLIETTYSKELETGLSVVLIHKDLDTVNGRSRIMSHISSHREILPTRMTWPTGTTFN